jgi:hypothetical protein
MVECNDPDIYDDPGAERRWCVERRAEVAAYLAREGVIHRTIGEWPAWHVAPYLSVWAIESLKAPGAVGWWVICGDLPTDYVSAAGIVHPRDAMRAIAQRWREAASVMACGEQLPDYTIGSLEEGPGLAPLLEARAKVLTQWADDKSLWHEADEADSFG